MKATKKKEKKSILGRIKDSFAEVLSSNEAEENVEDLANQEELNLLKRAQEEANATMANTSSTEKQKVRGGIERLSPEQLNSNGKQIETGTRNFGSDEREI